MIGIFEPSASYFKDLEICDRIHLKLESGSMNVYFMLGNVCCRSEFDWIDNLSITEMEHVHGAFRCQNPNALFLLRNPSFLQSIPNDVKSSFVDESLISAYKG